MSSSSFETPSLTLKLKNPAAEKEWSRDFAEALRKNDVLCSYVILGMSLSVVYRNFHQRPNVYIFILGEVFINTAFAFSQIAGPSFYAANRATTIGIFRVVRVATHVILILLPPNEEIAFPLITSPTFSWSMQPFWKFFYKTALIIIQSLAFRAPFSQHIWLISISLATAIGFTDRRCHIECDTNPSFYSAMYSSTIGLLSPLQKYMIAPVSVNLMESSSCRQMCDITHMFSLLFLAGLCPTMILTAFEEPSRQKTLQRYGGSFVFYPPKALLLYSLLLLPVLAVITFEFISTIILLLDF